MYKIKNKPGTSGQCDLLLLNVEFRWEGTVYEPNLGMLSIGTFAASAGYSVCYYDTQLPEFDRDRLCTDLSDIKPAVIGISTNSDNIYSITTLIPTLRRCCPDTLIVLGGPHATAKSESTLTRTGADVVVAGEGELTTVELLDCWIKRERNLTDIDGISYRKDDIIHTTDRRDFISDLDSLPIPDRNLLIDPNRYTGLLISGRGCPYHCAFCFEGTTGNKYRWRSAESTFAELELLIDEFKYEYLTFADDTFVADPARVKAVCNMIIDKYGPEPGFSWYCEGRIDILDRHPDLIPLMVKAGLVRLQLGVETGCQDVLDLYNKQITLDQIERIVSLCAEHNVTSLFVNFIIGGPFESQERLATTTDFALQLCDLAPGRIECYSTFLTPFPGTKITTDPARFGLKPIDPDMELSESMSYPFFETDDMNKWDLINARLKFDVAIGNKMQDLIAKVPKKLIDQHMAAYNRGMRSLWLSHFLRRKAIERYYQILHQGSFSNVSDHTTDQLMNKFPLRIIAPVAADNDRLVLLSARRELKLNEEGTIIYELCSGRRTVHEVIQTAYDRVQPGISFELFSEQVVEFLYQMEAEFAIACRDI